MSNNQDKSLPSASVQLDGFAPSTGAGAGASPVFALTSAPTPAAAGGGGDTGDAVVSAPPAPSTNANPAEAAAAKPQNKRVYKKRGPKRGGAIVGGVVAAALGNNAGGEFEEDAVMKPLCEIGVRFEPLSLAQIQLRIRALLDKLPRELPEIPPDSVADIAELYTFYGPVKSFASSLQTAVEEYNLLLSLVSSATYKWGVDRSGASAQNLSVLSAELQSCQENVSNVVSPRLSNVLCPAVDVLIGEVEIVRGEGDSNAPAKKRKLSTLSTAVIATDHERRINHYSRPLVDPSYVHLCHCILARNAPLIRHTVATSIHTAQRVIGDYLNAMKKDLGHETSKGGYY